MKDAILEAVKLKLIEMAMNDTLPLDMTQLDLDESMFPEAFAPLDEALSIIATVRESCVEGLNEDWDCSTNEGREGFQDMITLLDEADAKLK